MRTPATSRRADPLPGQRAAALEGKKHLPLGISEREEYPEEALVLVPGDQVIFCTDGITDAENDRGESFGIDGLDKALAHCPVGAQAMVDAVIRELSVFTGDANPIDDRTLLAAKFVAAGVDFLISTLYFLFSTF